MEISITIVAAFNFFLILSPSFFSFFKKNFYTRGRKKKIFFKKNVFVNHGFEFVIASYSRTSLLCLCLSDVDKKTTSIQLSSFAYT